MKAAWVRRLFMADEPDRLMELFNEARAKGTAERREAHLDNRDLAVAGISADWGYQSCSSAVEILF